MSAPVKLLLSTLLLASALAVAAAERTPVERALYPSGVPSRFNGITSAQEVPDFLLLATAPISPERQAVVWAERAARNLRYDKVYFVHVAVLESAGDELRVLDRRELTNAIPLFVEFPGHAADVKALATTFTVEGTPLVAVELWSAVSGTGGYSAASNIFLSVSDDGKLQPALQLERTYSSGRDAGNRSTVLSAIRVAGNALTVETRNVRWLGASPPQCGAAMTKHYRFDGTTYVEAGAAAAASGTPTELPRFPFEEMAPCAN